MSRTKKVQAAWDMVPVVECKKKCQDNCTQIRCSISELNLIKKFCKLNDLKYVNVNEVNNQVMKDTIKNPSAPPDLLCKYLKDGTCMIYEVRPTICRLFGAVDDLICPHDCKVRGAVIKANDAHDMINNGILKMDRNLRVSVGERRRLGRR